MSSPLEQLARLGRRLERERRARREAEQIAERTVLALYDRQRELELLAAVAAAANEATTLEQALRVAIEKVCSHVRWPVGHAYLATGPDCRLHSPGIWHVDDRLDLQEFRRVSEARTFNRGEGLPGMVAATGEPAWLEDAMNDDDFLRKEAVVGDELHGAFAFPILLGAEVVAVIEIFNDLPAPLDSGLLRASEQIGAHLGRVVERARAREKIAYQGLHDALTGLPNRVLLIDRVERALGRAARSGPLVGVLFIDLDRFKFVNDSYGHAVGDRVLIEVSRRLRGAIRPGDTVARLGGDEFVVLCEDLDHESQAVHVAERVQLRLVPPFKLAGGEEHAVSSSVGVSVGRAADTHAEALLRDADAAMYRAKDQGRARHEVFDDGMRNRVLDQLRIERALSRAIDGGELRLHYQPLVSLVEGTVEGVEALVRWKHPERGTVPPSEFVPVAEQSGLILGLGEWVLAEACRQASEWRRDLGAEAPLPVAVNLSARQLCQEDLAGTVRRVLVTTGLDARDLALEITESALIENADVPARTLAALRDLGVKVMLDDFGTGYSSLSYLQRFPVDVLKIDRSFVAELGIEPEASAIVGAIVGMGHALGMEVVAEGIETEQQARAALGLGCKSGQGFLFAPPAPPAEIRASAERSRAASSRTVSS